MACPELRDDCCDGDGNYTWAGKDTGKPTGAVAVIGGGTGGSIPAARSEASRVLSPVTPGATDFVFGVTTAGSWLKRPEDANAGCGAGGVGCAGTGVAEARRVARALGGNRE